MKRRQYGRIDPLALAACMLAVPAAIVALAWIAAALTLGAIRRMQRQQNHQQPPSDPPMMPPQ